MSVTEAFRHRFILRHRSDEQRRLKEETGQHSKCRERHDFSHGGSVRTGSLCSGQEVMFIGSTAVLHRTIQGLETGCDIV